MQSDDNGLHTENNSAANISTKKVSGKSVSVGCRIKNGDYNDLVATFKAVHKHEPTGDTELLTTIIQYYTKYARLGKPVNTAENKDGDEVVKLKKLLTDASERYTTVSKDLQTANDELTNSKNFVRNLENVLEEQKELNTQLQQRFDDSFLLVKANVNTNFFTAMQRRIEAKLSKSPEDFINQLFIVAKDLQSAGKFSKNEML